MPATLTVKSLEKHRARREAERKPLALPARVTWKDGRGTTRFASVITRDVSDNGVFIEWSEPATIPLYRLVTLQLERDARNIDGIPAPLRAGKVLSAVYRMGSFRKATGTPEGYGLRIFAEPAARSSSAASRVEASA